MVALKINRFNLLELGEITIRCQKCGFGVVVNVRSGRFAMAQCPSCKQNFGESAESAFHHFLNAYLDADGGKERFRIEFDVVDKS